MDRMATFLKYAIWIVLFFIFSEFMIKLNLETNYNALGRKDNIAQVKVYQAEATRVNGRIKGNIFNDENNKIENIYLKIDYYSTNNNLLGSKYIDVSNMRDNETRNFEAYFKLNDVKYYEMKFVNKKDEQGELPEMVKDLTKGQVLLGTALAILIFW